MLRKISNIFIALFLMVSTSGLSFSMHYCGDKYVSTTINKEAKSCCDGTSGCCENKTLHFEIEDDYLSPIVAESIATVELDVLFPVHFVLSAELLPPTKETTGYFSGTAPPPTIQTRLSLLQTYLY